MSRSAEIGRQRGQCGRTGVRDRQSNQAIGHNEFRKERPSKQGRAGWLQAVLRQQRRRAGAGGGRTQRYAGDIHDEGERQKKACVVRRERNMSPGGERPP